MWHIILGHCNVDDVTKLEHVVKGMHINNHETFDCETCTMAKQQNTRNHQTDTRATKPFELVHTDLAGPIDPVAMDGFRYAMIFTDDYSGCLFTYYLKEKSDAPKALEKFLADIVPYGKVKTLNFFEDVFPSGEVKRMRSDNGGEYISREFKHILTKHSIKHELSAPYSPHQNGTAERNWRTLFEMGRALLIESGLPKFLWTYAIMTATYIRNCCYVKRIKDTPYGLITGVKPNLAHLHIFGTICYAYVHGQKKLDPRCRKGYFVGFDKESPSYLVFNPEDKSVTKHRLVKFTDKFEVAETNDPANDLFPKSTEAEPQNGTTRSPTQPEVPQSAMENVQPQRYPKRNRKPPGHLVDYHVADDNEQQDYCYFLNTPTSYNEAVSGTDSANWKRAMDEEIESLERNETFTVTELPADKTVVEGKWVYTVKGSADNPVYKARYVARGFSQREGIDYSETFSPTARMESVRMLVQIAVQENWLLHQMDVKGAYLHAPIECEVYVQQPPGYQESPNAHLVWKLNKSLYGLKQSGRNWHNLHQYLQDTDFEQSSADPCVFIKHIENDVIILLVWVDDIIIASSSKELMDDFKQKLSNRFNMKDLGELSSFLAIEFERTNETITMSQSCYLKDVLSRFGFDQCKPRTTPCEANPNSYHTDDESVAPNESEIKIYHQMVGSLVYAMTCTRPDLSYCITKLSQHLSKPEPSDWIMLKHVFRYISNTVNYKLTFDDRRSISGYCLSLKEGGPPISWKSKKQASVALSTCEAEYMSLSITCQEAIYLTRLLTEHTRQQFAPTVMKSDNQGAIALIKNPVKHMKSKHIDIRYHFVRECYQDNHIVVEYVPSSNNIADMFTKPPKRHMLKTFEQYLFGQ